MNGLTSTAGNSYKEVFVFHFIQELFWKDEYSLKEKILSFNPFALRMAETP